MDLRLYSEKTPHVLTLSGELWAVFCEDGVKIDRVITAPHCIFGTGTWSIKIHLWFPLYRWNNSVGLNHLVFVETQVQFVSGMVSASLTKRKENRLPFRITFWKQSAVLTRAVYLHKSYLGQYCLWIGQFLLDRNPGTFYWRIML